MKKLLLSIFLILLIASPSTATIWYVDVDTVEVGNDGSEASPWTELDQIDWGEGYVVAGDTVRIMAGTYSTALTVGASGSVGLPITIYLGYDGQATIDGNGSLANGILIRDVSYINVYGYSAGGQSSYSVVTSCTGYGVLIDEYSGSRSNIKVQYVQSTLNGYSGFKINGAGYQYNLTDIEVSYCVMDYNGYSGIDAQFYHNSNSVLIDHNWSHHNNTSGGEFQGVSLAGRFAKYPATPFAGDTNNPLCTDVDTPWDCCTGAGTGDCPSAHVQYNGNVYYISYAVKEIAGTAWQWNGSILATNRELTRDEDVCENIAANYGDLTDGEWCFDEANNRIYFNFSQDPPTDNFAVITGNSGIHTVTNNIIEYNNTNSSKTGDGVGIYFDNGTANSIAHNNIIRYNGGPGITVASGIDDTIYYNVIYGNGTDLSENSAGIKVRRHSDGIIIYNNVIDSQGSSGDCILLMGYNAGTITMKNNICTNIPGVGLNNRVDGHTDVTSNNLLYAITGDTTANVTNTNGRTLNPLFVNPPAGDYRTKPGGDGENLGVDVSLTLDAANNAVAATPDIGAYEVVTTFHGVRF